MVHFGLALLAWCFAGSVIAQSSTLPTPPPAGTAGGTASTSSLASGKAAAAGGETKTQKADGASRASNRKPMDIRLQDGGVKLPKCAIESREGEACSK